MFMFIFRLLPLKAVPMRTGYVSHCSINTERCESNFLTINIRSLYKSYCSKLQFCMAGSSGITKLKRL